MTVMTDTPGQDSPAADPSRDQKIARLRDLERFRALIDPYVTDSSADVREALDRMSPAERTEAEEILDRVGTFDRARRAREEKQLRTLAALEVTLRDVLARQTDPQVVQNTQEALARLERLRNQIIGLDEDDEE